MSSLILTFSRTDAITFAACPTCCAFRGEPCTFSRAHDPYGKRAAAGMSHDARVIMAKKNHEKELALKLKDL